MDEAMRAALIEWRDARTAVITLPDDPREREARWKRLANADLALMEIARKL